jgi:hypothetical protein
LLTVSGDREPGHHDTKSRTKHEVNKKEEHMPLKRIVVAVVALGALGTGTGYALAQGSHSPSTVTANTPSSSTSGSASGHPGKGKRGEARHRLLKLRTLEHAQWVTRDPKTNKDVTHEAVVGTVTVGSASITVKAADGYTATFTVNSDTKIHIAGSKGAQGKLSDVKSGAKAVVVGTKSDATLTATQVLTRKK